MSEDTSKSSLERATNRMEGKYRRRSRLVVLRVPILLSAMMPDGGRAGYR